VVDDNKDNLKVASNYLKEKGYKIALALDGPSALHIMEQHGIDLVLLDVMMPGMDGFQTCQLLKQNPATRDVPVVFLTALSEANELTKCFAAGGADYITKPFRKEELFARVLTHVKLKVLTDHIKRLAATGHDNPLADLDELVQMT
jgi:CheY-like chemotaxis protein